VRLTVRGPARLIATAAWIVAVGVAGPRPVAADPPEPTDFRSVVDAVDPAVDGVDVTVIGGDAFLELSVSGGHEVVVAGYEDEAYLRVRADGTVERNRRSPATYLNDDRRGAVALPPDADPEAAPDWEHVASGGTYAWHDHRIHWMQPGRPEGVEPGDVVQAWTVPLTVDGRSVEVHGRLLLAEPVRPAPWIAAAVVAAGLVVAGTRRSGEVARVAVAVAGALAVVAATAQYVEAPPGSGASAVPVVTAVVGLVAGVAGLVVHRRDVRAVATLAAGAAVIGWALLRLEVLWTPVLPTAVPYTVDRGLTAVALGLAAAGAVLVAWSGGLAGAGDR
jgi:hypothetical protein